MRGEEPVFVVTGRKEDVGSAKREILSAAEHFSQIRATRRNNMNNANNLNGSSSTNGSVGVGVPGREHTGPPSPNAPGQVTIQVRVPYRVVGLVVGPKGATIKRIQQQTHTYIVTPSRDKEPVFEVTGLPENVEKAREEIESHIAMRTGGLVDAGNGDENDFHSNGVDSGFHDLNSDMVSSIYKPPSSNSAFTSYSSALNSNNILSRRQQEPNIFNFPIINGHGPNHSAAKINDFAITNGFNANGFNLYNDDEGIASPSFDPSTPLTPTSNIWPEMGDPRDAVTIFGTTAPTSSLPRRSSSMSSGTSPRLSPTLTESTNGTAPVGPADPHQSLRRIRSDPLSGGLAAMTSNFAPLPGQFATSTSSLSSSTSTSPTDTAMARMRRPCIVCNDSLVVAALVPCGHNLFCMECANLITDKSEGDRRCPVCNQTPTQAIRIFS